MEHEEVASQIIGAAIEVHKTLGPGLLESAYEACLFHELTLAGLEAKRQLNVPVHYKGVDVDAGFRLDLLVADLVVVELKMVEQLLPIHTAQVVTYLKLADKRVGLLINFNVKTLREGLRRIVQD